MLDTSPVRNNNFGILRLFFASLVILGHSPEIIDGNRSREILTNIFGTLSFGEVSVDSFFIISGYLITSSYVDSRGIFSFLSKRVARIVPGYLVSFWVCVFLISALAGGLFPLPIDIIDKNIYIALHLMTPVVPGSFQEMPFPSLNGVMWTIAYEFRCYMLVLIMGLSGLFSGRLKYVVPCIAGILLGLNASGVFSGVDGRMVMLLGRVPETIRLTSIFLCGSSFFLFRDKLVINNFGASASAIAVIVFMFFNVTANAAVGVFGAYLIFWFAFVVAPLKLSRRADKFDISYGMYLYAWPIQSMLVYRAGIHNPWIVAGLSLAVTPLPAALSWVLIEKPALRLAKSHQPPAAFAV